jgi:hypothetical protein
MFSIPVVQASECRSGAGRAEPINRHHLVEPLEDTGGNTGGLAIEAAGEIAQQPFGLIGIVEFPSLP